MGELHPVMQRVIDQGSKAAEAAKPGGFDAMSLEEIRAFVSQGRPPAATLPWIHDVRDIQIPGPGGEIPLRIYRPSDALGLPALVWFHGGGWFLGDLDGSEHHCRRLAVEVGCVVVSADYRLAPETPFPGAIDDCYAATAWVASSAVELGVDPARIAVGGDSSGGNLAACVALCARADGPPLAYQLLVYPVVDADFDRPSYRENGEGYSLTRQAVRRCWDCYVPNVAERKNPLVAPIHAPDLSGIPAALIITAEFDPLRDEGDAYGAALRKAGVDAVTQRYDGMIHGFFGMVTPVPVEQIDASFEAAVSALRVAFDV